MYEDKCETVYSQECRQGEQEVCQEVAEEECQEVPVQKCTKAPHQDCSQVDKEVSNKTRIFPQLDLDIISEVCEEGPKYGEKRCRMVKEVTECREVYRQTCTTHQQPHSSFYYVVLYG